MVITENTQPINYEDESKVPIPAVRTASVLVHVLEDGRAAANLLIALSCERGNFLLSRRVKKL
jgi:hypothetical protein